jgi:hypothetical protein
LAKIERVTKVYKNVANTPKEIFTVLKEQQERLEAAREEYGDYILPERLELTGKGVL